MGGDEADLLAPPLGKRARYALVQDLGIKFCSNLTQCVIDIWSTFGVLCVHMMNEHVS